MGLGHEIHKHVRELKNNGTHKGPIMYRAFHQLEENPLVRDDYVSMFFDEPEFESIKKRMASILQGPLTEEAQWSKNVYLYAILREKNGDDIIEKSIAHGCRQIVNLGAGFCTRFFRLPEIRHNKIKLIEVDLPEVLEHKTYYIIKAFGNMPEGLSFFPMDFNKEDFHTLSASVFDNTLPTVYIWEGVNYYLPEKSVSRFLDFIYGQMAPGSAFVFDCCTPLRLFKNDKVPGVGYNIDFLKRIGAPYLFGMYADEIREWLKSKGFKDIEILNQDDLEYRFINKRTIPDNMFYVVNIIR